MEINVFSASKKTKPNKANFQKTVYTQMGRKEVINQRPDERWTTEGLFDGRFVPDSFCFRSSALCSGAARENPIRIPANEPDDGCILSLFSKSGV